MQNPLFYLTSNPPPPMNHKSNKRTKSFSSKVFFIEELTIYKDMNTSFERKHKIIRSVCVLKTAAEVRVPKLAVSSSQYFYNLRAGRAADDKLVKICVHIPLLYNCPILYNATQCCWSIRAHLQKYNHFKQYLRSLQYESSRSANS